MPIDMELEAVLRPTQYPMPPYPPKVITLANGKKMVVRQAVREDVPAILKSVHPCLFIERDYYDIVSARLYGELLAKRWGQTIVVENRPGGDGAVAAHIVKSAVPDGYTLMVGSSGPMTVNVVTVIHQRPSRTPGRFTTTITAIKPYCANR